MQPPERGFFAGAVRRPVALLVLFAMLIVIGVIAYRRIPIQLVPDGWTAPSLWLFIPNEGADAQENEEKVARVIEEQLRTLPGIESYESDSSEDEVQMSIEFDGSMDMDLAKAEVRDRVERARPFLPDSVEQIIVWSQDGSAMPIAWFGILHPGDDARTDFLMDKVVVPRLEAVPGISKVDVWGVLQDSVRILLDEEKVTAQNLNLGDLIQRLARDNFALPLGEVDDGGRKVLLRSDMRFRSLEEIEAYPLANGLHVRDLGEVRRVKSVRNQLSRIDGKYSYFAAASKDSDSNVVETSRALREALEELEQDPRLAGEFQFLPFFLQGELIESSLDQLKGSALQGGLLAIVVLFVFLRRVRLTLCVACSIPVSALLAIAWEYFSGGSFNLLTMCGVTLGIGMLVDNSVVVIENVVRLRAEGLSAHRAAAEGTREIALAVTLATLTTVVVFLPLIFMSGDPMLRLAFGGIGIPLCLSLLFSLLVAVVFLPVIAARLLGPRPAWVERAARRAGGLTRVPVRTVAWIAGGLRGAWHLGLRATSAATRALVRVLAPLRFALALGALALAAVAVLRAAPGHAAAAALVPYGIRAASGAAGDAVALGIAALVVAAIALIGLPRWRARPPRPPARPARLVPAGESVLSMAIECNRALVEWTMRRRLAAFGLAVLSFLSIVVPLSSLDLAAFGDDPQSDSVRFEVRFEAPFTLAEAEQELLVYERWLDERREELGFAHVSNRFDERSADVAIYYDERQDAEVIAAVERRLQAELPRLPAHRLLFYDEQEATERSRSVAAFRIVGPDSATLERLAIEAERILSGVPGLSGVTSSRAEGPEQIRLDVDRDVAHQLGVDTESLQQTIAYVLHGFQLPRYQEEGRDVPFLIEYDQEKVAGLASLRDLAVWTEAGAVPISSFASLATAKGAHSIHRVGGRTSTTLYAEVEDPLAIVSITERAHRALEELDLPRGYEIDRHDSAVARQEAELIELLKALLLGVVLIFLLMGVLFESMLLPLSVLFTIPFAILGALWTLLLTGTPLDSMGMIGMIILAGVVVNNGIVLVDRIHRLYVEGVPRDQAVALGSSQRVRPVLMTAMTTVFGLIPMATARATGDGIDYRSLATIVAGGLVCSTFFTLWVVPLAYSVIQDLGATVSARARWWMRPARASAPAPAEGLR